MVKFNFHGGKNQFSVVVKLNFHGVKNLFIFSPVTRAISVSATRARVTLSFDWLAFEVKRVLVGNLTRGNCGYLIGWCGLEPRTVL